MLPFVLVAVPKAATWGPDGGGLAYGGGGGGAAVFSPSGGFSYTMGMADPTPKPTRRWFCPTPSWLIFGLLALECLLWLSEWFHWPTWHKG